jgi:phospho-N-acetylmuramoyl-pentapeptide-transferase
VLYHLFSPYASQYGGLFNLFTYISFRAVGAAATALLIAFVVGPMFLAALRRRAEPAA